MHASPRRRRTALSWRSSRVSHVVGYMGDGINDAPSLHAADVGISVSTGVDVAKDAADIILLEQSLQVLHKGILEGRKAFGNVIKYLLMGTSSNFGNMFSMAGAYVFLPFLPMLPSQILLNNFLYDLSQVTIPTDNVDASYIRKPQHWDIKLIRNFMIFIGPVSSIFDFLTFFLMLRIFHAGAGALPYWLVRGVARDPDTGPVYYSYGGQSTAQSPQSPARDNDAPDCRCWLRAPLYATCRTTWIHAAASPVLSLPGRDGSDLLAACPTGQAALNETICVI